MLSTGIDLSSNKISVVEMLKSRKGTIIKNAVNFDIPSDPILNGEIQSIDIFSKGLKEAWSRNKIAGKQVFIGLSNQKVIVKEVSLPLIDEGEISSSIKYQINDFIPLPKDNIIYDYYIMEKDKTSSRIMLIGAMKNMIFDVIKGIKNAGLFAQAIDLNCFALYRTIDQIYKLNKNKDSICIVNVGPEISIIEIITEDILKYPRFISNSLKSFIDNMAKGTGTDEKLCSDALKAFDFSNLNSSTAESTDSKIEGKTEENLLEVSSGINKKINIGEEEPLQKEDINSFLEGKNVIKILKKTASNFVNEINISIEHFMQNNPKVEIKKIILTGENLINFDSYIKDKTNYIVERLKIENHFPLGSIGSNPVNKGKDASEIVNALGIGMALRGLS